MADQKENNPEAIMDAEQPQQQAPPQAAPAAAAAPEPVKPTTSPAAATKTSAAQAISALGNLSFKHQMGLLLIFSIVELISGSIFRGKVTESQFSNYSVAVGAVSVFFAGVAFAAEAFGMALGENIRFFLAVLLWSWWFTAAVALTFFGPFQNSGVEYVGYYNDNPLYLGANGYFSTWLAFFVSCLTLSDYTHKLGVLAKATEATSSTQALAMTLFWTSAIVMGAGIQVCPPSEDPCYKYDAFGLALGVISMGLTFLFIVLNGADTLSSAHRHLFAHFLVVWWVVGALVMTFGGPVIFVASANGYYGCWFSVLAAIALLKSAGDAQ